MRSSLLVVLLLASPLPRANIEWAPSYADALAEAKAEKRVVFVALNMDGEAANDRAAKKLYRDKRIVTLAQLTTNLIASADKHSKDDKPCSRFKGVTCKQHRLVDIKVRTQVMGAGETDFVVAPQHLFLRPDGSVILSVPFEISAGELEWCFDAALRAFDPEYNGHRITDVHRPRRLIMGEIDKPKPGSFLVTRDQALELIKELKKGGGGEEAAEGLYRLALADEPEARKYLLANLRVTPGGGGGFDSPTGASGGGGAGGMDTRPELLHWIGLKSPQSYWEVCADFVSNGSNDLRREAVVALEQLSAPESLKVLIKEQRREKRPELQKNLLRAIGAVGRDEKTARTTLLKVIDRERDELLRTNALVALGWLGEHQDIDGVLFKASGGAEPALRLAAVVAMGISRRERWLPVLKDLEMKAGSDAELAAALEAARAVIGGSQYTVLRDSLRAATKDEIERDRLFPERL